MPGLLDLPPELLMMIVDFADAHSTYTHPSERLISLNMTCTILHTIVKPFLPRSPLLRCHTDSQCVHRIQDQAAGIENLQTCPHAEYHNRDDLDAFFQNVISLNIDLRMKHFLENPSDHDGVVLQSQPDCLTCIEFAVQILQHLQGPSPFTSVTCLTIELPEFDDDIGSPSLLLKRRRRCTQIIQLLFRLPRLRHLEISDNDSSGSLPLPKIPSRLTVELGLGDRVVGQRLKDWSNFIPTLLAFRSSNFDPVGLRQWVPSLRMLLIDDLTSELLQTVVSVTEFRRKGFYLTESDAACIIDSGCMAIDLDFERPSLSLAFCDGPVGGAVDGPLANISKLIKLVPKMMPRITHFLMSTDFDPMPVVAVTKSGITSEEMDALISCLADLPFLISLSVNVNYPFDLEEKWRLELETAHATAFAEASSSLLVITLSSGPKSASSNVYGVSRWREKISIIPMEWSNDKLVVPDLSLY